MSSTIIESRVSSVGPRAPVAWDLVSRTTTLLKLLESARSAVSFELAVESGIPTIL